MKTARHRAGIGRRWMRRAALLAVVGLLFHALLPLLHVTPARAATGLADAGIICTPFGIAVLPDETPPQPSGEGHVPLFGMLCPICIASQLASLAVLPGAAPSYGVGASSGPPSSLADDIFAPPGPPGGPIQSRAPPAILL